MTKRKKAHRGKWKCAWEAKKGKRCTKQCPSCKTWNR